MVDSFMTTTSEAPTFGANTIYALSFLFKTLATPISSRRAQELGDCALFNCTGSTLTGGGHGCSLQFISHPWKWLFHVFYKLDAPQMMRIFCMLSTVAITPNQKGDVNSPGEPQPLYMHLCITQFAYPIIL